MKTQHIIPAIIPESLEHLRSHLRDMRGVARRVQIDVMDGTYAPTSSWPYVGASKEAFEAIRREDSGLPYWQEFSFEIDLMVREPEKRIQEWALAGVSGIIFHLESTQQLNVIAEECHKRRIEMGIAIKPSTDIALLAPHIDRALFIQVMGNTRIGYHGVALEEDALTTIQMIKERWPHVTVGIDIGVSTETIPKLCNAGATRFAAGSAVFGYGVPANAFAHLENLVLQELSS